MSKKIAILHTSFVFVSVEPAINNLIEELIPDAEVIHFVDSDVLATVVREQGISPKSEERMTHLAQAAEAAGADIIFSACSSLGPALDVAARHVTTPVVKIDEAMAIRAAAEGTRIGVLATVPTTLGPTSDLDPVQGGRGGSSHHHRAATVRRRIRRAHVGGSRQARLAGRGAGRRPRKDGGPDRPGAGIDGAPRGRASGGDRAAGSG